MNFRVGQKVVCIDDSINPCGLAADYPVRGRVYTVRSIHPDGDAIFLIEVVNTLFGGMEPCFLNHRFRPVVERKTDVSIFKAILDSVKSGELV